MFARSKCNVKKFSFILVLCFRLSSAVIYNNLNDTEYKKLPPIFYMDPYQEYLEEPEGLYCDSKLALVADDENPLLNLIQEYSHSKTRYNHSLIRYHLCVTKTCKEYYNDTTTDLADSLEACLNKTFYDLYGLKTKVLNSSIHCKSAGEKIEVEVADLCMWALLIGILTLNLVGSLYDFTCTNGKTGGIRWLTSFAIRRNWRKLVAPTLEGPDSRLKRLKVLSGIKNASTVLVITAHCVLSSALFNDNPKFVEDSYKNLVVQLFINGTILVQTFFVMSGFFLTYNLELMREKKNFHVNWMLLPKGIIMRWIRFTPTYAILLFFTITCSKYLVDGPLWHYGVISEANDCKQYWWQHLLYINNYNDVSSCMIQTWYLASDTQLCILGLVVYIICRSPGSRKVVLPVLLLVAIAIPVGQTYWLDLDGVLAGSPENAVNFLLDNPTFNHLYKRGHNNMFSYFFGMGVGYIAYYGQKIDYDVQKYRKYRFVYYATVPVAIAMIMSGKVFFNEGPRPSLAVRMLFAAYQKPVWCLFIGLWVLGAIFKHENFVRGLLEWRGWTPLSRLSYSAYLVHLTVIRLVIAQTQTLMHITILSGSERSVHFLVVTYLVALFYWMLVEQPFSQLVKMASSASKEDPVADGIKRINEDPINGDKKNAQEELTQV